MVERIIEYSIRNKFFVIIVTLVVIAIGIYAMINIPLDALPDLSDVQVIVFTEYPGQAPQVVEDQVTYPIASEMLKVPGAETVWGYSFFGVSFVYIIFDDDTDLYWARSRVLEYLSSIRGKLPEVAEPSLAPPRQWPAQVPRASTTGCCPADLRDCRGIPDRCCGLCWRP